MIGVLQTEGGNEEEVVVVGFGQNVKRLRLQLGLDQLDLALQAGLSAGYISKIESGKAGHKRGVAHGKLESLARALRVTPEELLGIEEFDHTESIERMEFLRRLEGLWPPGTTIEQIEQELMEWEKLPPEDKRILHRMRRLMALERAMQEQEAKLRPFDRRRRVAEKPVSYEEG